MNDRPLLVKKVRVNGYHWKDIYDKWLKNGENDPFFKEDDKREKDVSSFNNKEVFNTILKLAETVDLEKLEKQIGQFNQSLQTVQTVLNEYLNHDTHAPKKRQRSHLFDMFMD